MSDPIFEYPAEVVYERVKQHREKIERLEAELAELRASSVLYRVRCENPECRDGEIATLGPEHTDPCPDCVDGWQLVDGVERVDAWRDRDAYGKDGYFIPARLIEGDT